MGRDNYLRLQNRIKFLEEQNRHLLDMLARYEVMRPIQVVVDIKDAANLCEIKRQMER